MGNRTTQRVVCPSCGELLRPTPELLLGLDGIACKCGFRAADRMPGAQQPKAGPSRAVGVGMLVGGAALVAASLIAILVVSDASRIFFRLMGLGLMGGAVVAAEGARRFTRSVQYHASARLLGDMIVRRTLVDGVRRIYREEGRAAAKQANAWLKAQGVSSSEFRRDLMRDARGVTRA